MAIYGSISDLPAPEILNMLSRRTGLLRLTAGSGARRGSRYGLYLDQDELVAMFMDTREITDTMIIRDMFRGLLDLSEGSFEFESLPEENMQRSVRLSVKQLVLSTATIIDELDNYRSRFPHPDIVFQVTSDIYEHLPGDLELFWMRAEPHLRRGISANKLADELNLSIDEVQLNFYKLRSAGHLMPVRSYTRTRQPAASDTAPGPNQNRPNLIKRLMFSLSRIGRNSR